MRKLTLLLLILPIFISAQEYKTQILDIESFSMLESKTLSSKFFIDFYTGQFLDSSLKSNTLNTLSSSNNLGYFSLNSVQYGFIKKDKKIGPYFCASYNKILGMEFSDKAFELVFNGNESFSGQNLSLLPLNLQMQEFSTIQSGIMFMASDKLVLYASAGPAFGMGYQHIDTKEMQMFTSDITDSIALRYNLNFTRTPANPVIKGYGFSGSVGLRGKVSDVNYSFSINNLGMLWYLNQSVSTTKDSLIEFNGFDIDELGDISSSIDDEISRFENALSLTGDTASIKTLLPYKVQVTLQKIMPSFTIDFKSIYMNMPGFFPYFELKPSKRIYKSIYISLPVKYGGFGTFNAGLGLEGIIYNNINFKIFSPALLTVFGAEKNLSYGIFASVFFKLEKNESSF